VSDAPLRYSPPLLPELQLSYHPDLAAREAVFPGYFATDWAAGQVLARHVLDRPELVRDKVVLDFGTGSGILALAAKLAGATRVIAIDRDDRAVEATRRNARGMSLEIEAYVADPITGPRAEWLALVDVVLAGDVLYPDAGPDHVWRWLVAIAREGRHVLVSDPGRIPRIPPGLREREQVRALAGKTCAVYEIDVDALPDDEDENDTAAQSE
jgi:predicted nicotinamide N-methyase